MAFEAPALPYESEEEAGKASSCLRLVLTVVRLGKLQLGHFHLQLYAACLNVNDTNQSFLLDRGNTSLCTDSTYDTAKHLQMLMGLATFDIWIIWRRMEEMISWAEYKLLQIGRCVKGGHRTGE